MHHVSRLPRDDNDSGWWHLEPPGKVYPPISEDLACDYAVVGAGWTGLAAARRLAEGKPNARIVVVDAGAIGYGAAGRNSGFLYDIPFVFGDDAFRGREEEGRREIRLYRAVIDEMRQLVRGRNANCGWSEIGQYHVAVDGPAERELAHIETGLRNLGETYSVLGSRELSAALGTDYYRTAIHTPGTVQVNPLALLRLYADAMPANVEIFERSPVTKIESGAKPRVVMDAGCVTAEAVLLTTNAFLSAFGGLRPRLLPAMTFAGLTKPVGQNGAPAPGGLPQWGLVPASLFGTSMRRLADGRLLVRNTYAYAPDFKGSRGLRARARRRQSLSLRRRFPDMAEIEPEWSWGGVISFFRGANGSFGEVAPNMYAASTSGMPMCVVYGQQLAELALGGGGGGDGDGEGLAFVRRRSQPGALPPKPVLGLAARASTGLRQRRAWKEI